MVARARLAPKFLWNFMGGAEEVGPRLRSRRVRPLLLVAVLLFGLAATASAQMDMLPQIFRDLPPELQEGLPEQMSFAEYRALNRNVDFFTMFMSMFVPGYGLFQVERPELGWTMVGARAAGVGLMVTGVALQWNYFYDLVESPRLPAEAFNRLLTNGLISGTGLLIGGVTWAADVVLAYHFAKQDKDLVQYTYGLRSSIYGSGQGGSDAVSDETYLRRLLVQDGDRQLEEQLLGDLPEYARRYPEHGFSGEALYFASLLHAGRAEDPDALRLAIRSAYLYPRGERTNDALRLVARLVERNHHWRIGYEQAASIGALPVSEGPDARFLAGIVELSRFEDEDLTRAALAETRVFLVEYSGGPYVADGLLLAADLLLDLGRPDEAAGYLAAITINKPGSEEWPEATLRLAELYLNELRDRDRGRILLTAIVEHVPESEEAERANALLGQ